MLGTSCAERRGCIQLEWLHHSCQDFISRLRVEYVKRWIVIQWLQDHRVGMWYVSWWTRHPLAYEWLGVSEPERWLRYVGKMTNCFWNTQYTRSNGKEGEYTQQFISSQVIILSVDVRGRSRRISVYSTARIGSWTSMVLWQIASWHLLSWNDVCNWWSHSKGMSFVWAASIWQGN